VEVKLFNDANTFFRKVLLELALHGCDVHRMMMKIDACIAAQTKVRVGQEVEVLDVTWELEFKDGESLSAHEKSDGTSELLCYLIAAGKSKAYSSILNFVDILLLLQLAEGNEEHALPLLADANSSVGDGCFKDVVHAGRVPLYLRVRVTVDEDSNVSKVLVVLHCIL
jgi:hypothetical protein